MDANEILSRFIMNSKQFRASDQTVKVGAFIPPKNKPLSVFRTTRLREDKVWPIGEAVAAKPSGRPLYGRADFLVQTVYALRQKVKRQTSIHPLRADIIPLPDERDDMLLWASKLALKSYFIPKE